MCRVQWFAVCPVCVVLAVLTTGIANAERSDSAGVSMTSGLKLGDPQDPEFGGDKASFYGSSSGYPYACLGARKVHGG